MGQKVHPTSFRIGVTKEWGSRWYATKADFAEKLHQDIRIRNLINKELSSGAISHVDIERASNRVRVSVYSGKPGMVIGRKGAQIEKLKETVQSIVGDQTKLFIDIKEVQNPGLDAQIVAENISYQLEKRIAFRRAMKKTVQAHKDSGGKGIKIRCSGRLGGAEIARSESYKWGKVPLQTIRADIDYGFAEARTTYGIIGVKVWIYRGDKYDKGVGTEKVEVKKKDKKDIEE
ncbi:MAG: 30S ribosomal protein S3 [Candidatus Omnitrophica bacterium]|nr:30S ribosomal protein S3 [Candidatus Omnitrophota bacterium]MDD5487392.1 30S ribosomal protein S3 [Candidatus Omnitrophota bacterium]